MKYADAQAELPLMHSFYELCAKEHKTFTSLICRTFSLKICKKDCDI
jgi:hypothetical protein